jgi:hypothetical protein
MRQVNFPLFAAMEYDMFLNDIGELTPKGFPDVGNLIEPFGQI